MTVSEQVQNLQNQIDELKKQLFNIQFIPKEFRDNVLEIVFFNRDSSFVKTETIALSGNAQNISVPYPYSGYVITRYKGSNIKIPFV